MAQGITFHSVTGVLLGKLGSALWDEIGLLPRSFKDDVKDLERKLEEIKEVLLDAEERSSVEIEENEPLRSWLREMKGAAYDIDDLLDEIRTQPLLRIQQRELQNQNQLAKMVSDQFLSCANQMNVNFKLKMKELREKIDKIEKQENDFGLVGHRKQTDRETDSHVEKEKIVGRDDDEEEIVKLLLETNGDHDVSVIPIVGLGGLGKTTLAQLAFNDGRVTAQQAFDLRVWVYMSTDFDMKKIAEAVKSRTRGEGDLTTEESPESFLLGTFSQNKVLLVLDDVWNEEENKWEELKNIFKEGKKGSKILVTTRSEKVAKIMKTVEPLHVKGLSDDDCWTLFKRRAFEEGEENNYPSLVEIGKQIVKKCGGVPLAANALGSMMRSKSKTDVAWSAIRDSEIWRLKVEKEILSSLKLSYIQMPSDLKRCFAYCSIFPKDYEIDKDDLIQQWIALGFISSPDTSTLMEDIGNAYFEKLLWISFLQDVRKHKKSKRIICQMHNLVHDLAQSVAREEVAVILGKESTRIPEDCLYASIYSRFMPQVPTTVAQRLRAVRFRESASLATFCSEAKCLRVLELHDSKISMLPRTIIKLVLLRYLNLSGTNIQELPESITYLCSLQSLNLSNCREICTLPKSLGRLVRLEKLDITSCKNLCELPKMIQKLANLRKLLNKYCWKLKGMPRGIGKLVSLRELSVFVIGKQDHVEHCASISELKHLKLVGELEIKGLENVTEPYDAKAANLIEKKLWSLKLKWNVLSAAEDMDTVQPAEEMDAVLENLQPQQNLENLKIEGYGGGKFPSWMMNRIGSCLPNLKKIKLINMPKCSSLPPLEQLSILEVLYIWNMPKCSSLPPLGQLSTLEVLYIWNMPRCSSLPPLGQLPFLKVLYIWNVPLLTNIGSIAKMFPALTTLLLGCMPMLQKWATVDDEEAIFPRLTQLTLYNCPQLRPEPCLPASVENLTIFRTSKENLSLILKRATMDSETRPNDGDGAVSLQLPNKGLRELTIGDCLHVTCLPESLWSLTSLQSLTISGCEHLEGIDRGLGDLTELQSLYIEWCQRLRDLPALNMATLKELHIHGCPLLPNAERCCPTNILPIISNMSSEWIAFYLVNEVLGKLGSSFWDEIGLLRCFKDDANNVRSNFSAIQAVLLDAEERSSVEIEESHALHIWLSELKGAAYDIDDLLDEIRTQVLLRKQQRELQNQNQLAKMVCDQFLSCANPINLMFKFKMARRMKDRMKGLREKIDKIAKRRHHFGLVEAGPRRQAEFKRPETTISVVDEKEIVGRDEDKEKIVKLLLETGGDHDVSVIPIVGLGGLGKTTLAQLAFNDKRVTCHAPQHFDLRVWVCVSTDFNMKTIAKPVIDEAGEKCDDLDNLEAVARCLHKIISEKRFLLVLDDVWNEDRDKLELFKFLFRYGKKGSKILVTTRSEMVAEIMKTAEQPHRLKGLSDDDCWMLFKRRAFEEWKGNDYPSLVEIGKQIVKKCGGVPLAAKALGSMMHSKNKTEDAWSAIRDSEIWRLEVGKEILSSLELSYIQMPSALKQCFAYCSMFPKDYEIDKDDLIQQWIALGFISSLGRNTSMEDIGNEYFIKLLRMSFLQEVRKHNKSKKIICQMNNLVHNLAQSVAREEVAVIVGEESTRIPEGCRYASIYSRFMPQVPTAVVQRLRALRFRESASPMTFYSAAKCLRLLDFQDSNISVLPSSISKLKLLRYLNLSWTNIKELPESITDLCNLQTLNLSFCQEIYTLPKFLGRLANLRILNLSECSRLLSLPSSLCQLKNLHDLNLSYLRDLQALPESIGNLENLRILNLSECSRLLSLPSSLCQLKNLHDLNLSYLRDLHALPESIGNLENLRILNLSKCSSLLSLPSSSSDLQHLEILDISYCRQLCELPKMIQKLTKLRELLNKNCLELKAMPRGIGKLVSLWELPIFVIGKQNRVEHCASISELEHLKLVGELEIKGLENVTNPADAKAANMIEKNLQSLTLKWNDFSAAEDMDTVQPAEEMDAVLENLQPHQNLAELVIEGYAGRKFPSWMMNRIDSCLPNLVKIILVDMPRCSSLPPLGLLPVLEELIISDMPAIRNLGVEFYVDSHINEGANNFPALRRLHLSDMPVLREWVTVLTVDDKEGKRERVPIFPCLTQLTIKDCEDLERIEDWLGELTELEDLDIDGCSSLIYLPVHKMTTLTMLSIKDCPLLFNAGGDVRVNERLEPCLPSSIQTLVVSGISKECLSLILKRSTMGSETPHDDGDVVSLQQPNMVLSRLIIEKCQQLTCLPVGLRSFTSLQELTIKDCENLERIEDWIGELTKPEDLDIDGCSNLRYLPVYKMTTLTKLSIKDCPLLFNVGGDVRVDERPEACLPSSIQTLVIFGISKECLSLILKRPTMNSEASPDDDDVVSLQQPNMVLRRLIIGKCQQLTCLPESLRSFTSLQELTIKDCEDLKRIEDWIGELTELRFLDIKGCQSLRYLPAHKMTTLEHLLINGCPLLFNADGQFVDTNVDHIEIIEVDGRRRWRRWD